MSSASASPISGYTGHEVIPMTTQPKTEKVLDVIRQVMTLTPEELQLFHEEYKDYLVSLDWMRLGMQLNWDDDDDYSQTR